MPNYASILKDIVDRLDRLEQPHRYLAQSITAGIISALKESGAMPVQSAVSPSATNEPPVIEPELLKSLQAEIAQQDGIYALIGALPSGSIITEAGLATLFKRHPSSLKRAVQRDEFPPPIRFLGGPAWTAGAIIRHFEKRLEAEAKDRERLRRRLTALAP